MEITEHKKNKKYIFVTGGVVSGLGKGITAASLGRLLKARGLKIVAQKLDPYINVDPGTMSPPTTFRLTRKTASMTSKVRSAWIWICSATT